jgi:hypothetical protein
VKFAVLTFIAMAICCGCQTKASQAEVRHVLIAYPEHWTDGDRRACFLGPAGDSTVRGSVGQLDFPSWTATVSSRAN